MPPKLSRSILFFIIYPLILSCSREPERFDLESVAILVNGKTIVVELARDTDEQSRGLMFRRSLGENEGMLFVYDSPRMLSFWMKNTRLPLSIAFIDKAGRIVQIEEMKPYDTITRHRSSVPVQYALEMNRGWFKKKGIKIGDTVEIPKTKIQITNE